MAGKWDSTTSKSSTKDGVGRTDSVLSSNFNKNNKITSIDDIYITGASITDTLLVQFQEFNRQSEFN